jgi:hypothetical protein
MPCLLAVHLALQQIVTSKLTLDWPPEQISGWLKLQYPDEMDIESPRRRVHQSSATSGHSLELT